MSSDIDSIDPRRHLRSPRLRPDREHIRHLRSPDEPILPEEPAPALLHIANPDRLERIFSGLEALSRHSDSVGSVALGAFVGVNGGFDPKTRAVLHPEVIPLIRSIEQRLFGETGVLLKRSDDPTLNHAEENTDPSVVPFEDVAAVAALGVSRDKSRDLYSFSRKAVKGALGVSGTGSQSLGLGI